jgi:hypothetical protein
MKVEHSAVFTVCPLLSECSERKKKEYSSIAKCMLLLKTERGGSQNHSLLKKKRSNKLTKDIWRGSCVMNIIQQIGFFFFCRKRNVFVEVSSPTTIDIKNALLCFTFFCSIRIGLGCKLHLPADP